jgi:hypothetical protein
MNTARSIRHLLFLIVIVLPVGILSQPVEARSVAAATGVVGGPDVPCLGFFFGTVTNGCARTISLDWPLVVDSGGNKTVAVEGFGATAANNVGCRAEGLDAQTTLVWFSNGGSYQFLPSFGASAGILMTGAFVPSGGQLLVNCQINQGGRIQVANWNA